MVSEGEVVEETEQCVVEEQVETSENPPVAREECARVEADDAEGSGEVLAGAADLPSVVVEGEGDTQGGSADTGEGETVVDTITINSITADTPRVKLEELTMSDPSLNTARVLAEKEAEGYHWDKSLLFRSRLDEWGVNYKQLCLPLEYRSKCLHLSHEKFGHIGRNKMMFHLRKLFYWPSMSVNVPRHCKSCSVCQKHTKQTPKVLPMQEREVLTVPSERVCVDLVGPFPKARGGFQFLLTYIDMATRWPEDICIRKVTTAVIIDQLKSIFCRNGFPTTLVSDNGLHFKSAQFAKYLKSQGIQHVIASIYHPQGNGVVERMHGTLNAIIAKSVENKGNWAEIVPMCLYFMRCTPNRSAGVSPFLLKHGWEPVTPFIHC